MKTEWQLTIEQINCEFELSSNVYYFLEEKQKYL